METKFSRNQNGAEANESRNGRLDMLFIFFLIVFAVFAAPELFPSGDPSTFNLINNSRCFPIVGCNSGFFGYDGIAHIVGGILWTIAFIWLMNRYPRLHILHKSFVKSFFIIIACIALLHIAWELYEYILDILDSYNLQRDLYFHEIAQPGNADTIGDLTFGLIGAICGSLIVKKIEPRVFRN